MDYKPHPYAELFPMMGQKELASLAKDIAENGQRDAIVLDEDDLILDGRNRLRACALAEAEPNYDTFHGDDRQKLAFVISKNMERRHLDPSQRSLIAGQIATMNHGGDRKSENQDANLHLDRTTLAEAADQMNVSERSAANGRKVATQGAPELQEAVAAGEVTVSDAASIADLPKPVQKKAVKAKRAGKAKTVKKAAAAITPPKEPDAPQANPVDRAALKKEREEYAAKVAELDRKLAETNPRKGKTLKDDEGHPVPERIWGPFKLGGEFEIAHTALGALGGALTVIARDMPPGLIDDREWKKHTSALFEIISHAEPHIVCPKCMGDGCKVCGRYGFTRTGGQR